jgi:hypothetical protein
MSQLPGFLTKKDSSLLYNNTGELLYYIPEDYFEDTKSPVAEVVGQYVVSMGIFDWALVQENGKVGEAKPFMFPTIIRCKPHNIESVKELSLNGLKPKDYRILHFQKGDEAISDIYIPQIIDNVETMFKIMAINGGKIPRSVPYDKMHEYFPMSMKLNGNSYGLNMQMFGVMVSEICRDTNDLSKPFRLSNMKSMYNYQQISISMVPKYISPYVSLTSQNFDESLMAAITMDPKDAKYSPLEKVVTN